MQIPVLITAALLASNSRSVSSLSATTASSQISCDANERRPRICVIPNSKLFISEPDPQWFGNAENAEGDPSWTNSNWLKSRFHFSFAEYRNRGNDNFGVLRVMNDDLVQSQRGFGVHPHRDMEILTYVVHGELTHQDSMGTKETLGRGSIQFMTAGTGVRHSEHNRSDKPLRFIQTWIIPKAKGLEPNYGSMNGKICRESRLNQFQHLVSSVDNKEISTKVKINQDVDGHAAELEMGKLIEFDLSPGRQAYLLCIEGGVEINGQHLVKFDACEIQGGGRLEIKANWRGCSCFDVQYERGCLVWPHGYLVFVIQSFIQ